MTEREFDAISRLTAWLRDFGYRHTDVFNADLEAVLNMAQKYNILTETTLHALPTGTYTIGTHVGCTCHERDGSFSCPYCRSLGIRGHMEND
jgi:hypothetical protein